MLTDALKEYMLRQSNPESQSKIIDTLNEVTDTFPAAIKNSFVIDEKVYKFW